MADKPVTREEKYLAYLTGDYTGELPKPITRKEKYLYELCLKGIGGEISPEEIKAAVNEYLEKNPVKPGATTEQAQQIEQNKTDIVSLKTETDSLKEDISDLKTDVQNAEDVLAGKISKFYATNNGENHLADSDDGKIADMMVYGKSEQKSTTGTQLFDMSTAFAGWVGEDGTPRNDGIIGKADNIVSDYIPVESNTVYACNNNNNNNIFVWEYDSSKTLIKSDGQLNSESFTTSETAKYIVFAVSYSSAQTPDYIKTIMFNKGSSVLPWEPYTDGKPSPSPDYPQEIKSVVNPIVKVTNEDGLKVQSVTLNNITLNAIPVSSGGNVTINGQQYITDYVDVERGKVVRMCERQTFNTKNGRIDEEYRLAIENEHIGKNGDKECIFSAFKWTSWETCVNGSYLYIKNIKKPNNEFYTAQELKELSLDFDAVYQLLEQQETDLTTEENTAFKALATYYPTTNISVNSEQLDGYTVFNYPISMANGWNYVKQQLNDNRDYIYDMDTQSAEAYVNSEYAVALTELEV
jgi:hypothetical protein